MAAVASSEWPTKAKFYAVKLWLQPEEREREMKDSGVWSLSERHKSTRDAHTCDVE